MDSPQETESIYFEDPTVTQFLSQLESPSDTNDISQNNNSPYKNSFIDQQSEQDNIDNSPKKNKKLFDDASFQKSKIQNFLLINDYPSTQIDIDFYFEEISDTLDRYSKQILLDFSKCSLKNVQREMIYKAKRIEHMVEQTYNYDIKLKKEMTEESAYLYRVIYSWRRVAGDGNCYYRSVIFSYLEYLIFTENINVLKRIISNIWIKFNANYIYTKNLPENIKSILVSKETDVVMRILYCIIKQLENKDDKNKNINIFNAYELLLKAFNFSRSFDTLMIFYLRYSLYEYILENKNKVVSKDFPVLLGNLLPIKYQIENENNSDETIFLFEKYFYEDLLKFYTCAEQIAVYLTPFVLKLNLNVIFYDFGKDTDIETKFFPSYLNNKDSIYVLFRKAHYDICYNKEYINKYDNLISLYKNFSNNFCVLNENDVLNYGKNINITDPYQNDTSKIFNRVLNNKKKIENDNNNIIFNNYIDNNDIDNKDIDNNGIDNNDNENNNQNEEFEINNILNNLKKQVENQISCLFCTKLIPSNSSICTGKKLPCNCNFILCSEKCKKKIIEYYIKCIKDKNLIDKQNKFKCFNCEKEYSNLMLIQLSLIIEQIYNNNTIKNMLKEKIEVLIKENCMNCLKKFEKNENKVLINCKCDVTEKFFGSKKFQHFSCKDCHKKRKLGDCQICECYHYRIFEKK